MSGAIQTASLNKWDERFYYLVTGWCGFMTGLFDLFPQFFSFFINEVQTLLDLLHKLLIVIKLIFFILYVWEALGLQEEMLYVVSQQAVMFATLYLIKIKIIKIWQWVTLLVYFLFSIEAWWLLLLPYSKKRPGLNLLIRLERCGRHKNHLQHIKSIWKSCA